MRSASSSETWISSRAAASISQQGAPEARIGVALIRHEHMFASCGASVNTDCRHPRGGSSHPGERAAVKHTDPAGGRFAALPGCALTAALSRPPSSQSRSRLANMKRALAPLDERRFCPTACPTYAGRAPPIRAVSAALELQAPGAEARRHLAQAKRVGNRRSTRAQSLT
jgi:hypothetical protein